MVHGWFVGTSGSNSPYACYHRGLRQAKKPGCGNNRGCSAFTGLRASVHANTCILFHRRVEGSLAKQARSFACRVGEYDMHTKWKWSEMGKWTMI